MFFVFLQNCFMESRRSPSSPPPLWSTPQRNRPRVPDEPFTPPGLYLPASGSNVEKGLSTSRTNWTRRDASSSSSFRCEGSISSQSQIQSRNWGQTRESSYFQHNIPKKDTPADNQDSSPVARVVVYSCPEPRADKTPVQYVSLRGNNTEESQHNKTQPEKSPGDKRTLLTVPVSELTLAEKRALVIELLGSMSDSEIEATLTETQTKTTDNARTQKILAILRQRKHGQTPERRTRDDRPVLGGSVVGQ